MNRENLIGYISDPARLNSSSLPEVEELIETFPYFQTAYMLLARNHYNIDSLKFHETLRTAAAFAGDRTLLYHLINHKEKPVNETEPAPDREPADPVSGRLTEILQREKESGELVFGPAYSLEDSKQENMTDAKEHTASAALEEYTFTGWFDHVRETPAKEVHDSPEKNLIEKFIIESPTIRTDPGKISDQRDLAGQSDVMADFLMTETLAKIYLQQGLFRKAIYAYEKLSLKFPEKSTYFASQIDSIKTNMEKNS